MDNILHDVLSNINQGIVMLDEDLNVMIWNNYMQQATNTSREDVMNHSVYEVLPGLDKHYYRTTILNILKNGCKMFFSAAMHKGLINEKEYFNLRVSRISQEHSQYILLEFMNVTNEYIRINQLKNNINQLCLLNKGLQDKQDEIRNLAYFDELTAVANRTLFYEHAEKLLFDAKRNGYLLGLMFIDIDKFKNINDTYGHEVGDKVLIRVAEILKQATRNNDVVARYGGDEFLVLFSHVKSVENYKVIISKILSNPNKILCFDDGIIEISLSIGVSFYPNSGKTINQLIVAADQAMYIAKKGHLNCYCAAQDLKLTGGRGSQTK